MATTTNYTTNGASRKVDLYIMGAFAFDSNARQPLTMTIGADDGGQVCAGVVKVAQKVVMHLLTLTIPYDPEWGTPLTPLLLFGSQYQVQQSFESVLNSSISVLIAHLTAQDTDTTPLDEQIDSLYMTDWNLDSYNGTLTVSMQLTVRSGATTQIVVPISIVP